jgi:hypothetical protein
MKRLKVYYLRCWLLYDALDLVIIEISILKEKLIEASLGADLNDFLESLSLGTLANT